MFFRTDRGANMNNIGLEIWSGKTVLPSLTPPCKHLEIII